MAVAVETLVDLFETFAGLGEKTAFIQRTGVRRFSFSYSRFADYSLRMAALLEREGIGRGDRVLIWGPNSIWWAVAFWGTILRGAVVVPVDFTSETERAGAIATSSGAAIAIQSSFKIQRLPFERNLRLEELQPVLDATSPAPGSVSIAGSETAQIIYTSGTTGNPKGVVLTHGNLTANLLQVNSHIPVVTSRYNFLSLLPLSHMFEQMCGFFTPLYRGAGIVYLQTLKPSAIMEALGEEEIHALIAVPRLLQLLKNSVETEVEGRHLAPLFRRMMAVAERVPAAGKLLFAPLRRKFGRDFQLLVSGGAPLPAELFRFWRLLGFRLLEGYGLTECAPVLAANRFDRQTEGSVGWPLPGVELEIRDNELLARGKNVFPGYYGNEAATREAFTPDGWFRTGDIGEVAPDGTVAIKGRLKELIVTGAGVNVFPDELEEMLNGTAGVREAAVIGLDRGAGEEVHGVLLLDGSGRSPEEIVAEVNDRLDPLHRISGFTVWPDAEFPKTTTLKIRKFLVRERLQAGTGGGGAAADRLTAIVAGVTGASPGEIWEESLLVANLGLTSIGRLELVNRLEQEFRLDIDDSRIGISTTVADLRRMVAQREKVSGKGHFRFWTNSAPVRVFRRAANVILFDHIFRYFMRVRAEGLHHLDHIREPVLFIANHQSYFDHPAIMLAMPQQIRHRTATAAWEEFFFSNYRNRAKRLWKRIAYDLSSVLANVFPLPQSSSFRGSLRFMGRLADHGVNILVFPEGRRTMDGRIAPFQPGLGIMVKELAIPVVPVRIEGLEKLFPRGSKWPRRGEVRVTFGEQLDLSHEEAAEIVRRARQAVEELG